LLSAFLGRIKLNTPRQSTFLYAGALAVTYLFAEGMLKWGFPVLYLALNLIAAEAVKRRSNHAQKEWFMALAVVVVSGAVQYWTLAHLPLKDYRPYAAGESIVQNRMTAEELGLEGPEFDKEIRFFNADTGAETLVTQSRYMDEKLWDKNNEPGRTFNETYPEGDWDNARELKIKDGYEQRILDFQMVDAGGFDLTDDILASEKPVLLHISKDLVAMPTTWQDDFNALGSAAAEAGWEMFGLTNATAEEHAAFAAQEGATYPFLTCDQTELKIVVRANPGLVLIQDGVVIEKWAGRDVPSPEDLREFVSGR
jgi:peroxiredoxin